MTPSNCAPTYFFLNGQSYAYPPIAAEAPGVRDLAPAGCAVSMFACESRGDRCHSTQFLPSRPALRNFGPVTVPAGHYFRVGDNRDNSRVSRFFGFMPRAKIIGAATAVVASADRTHWLRPCFHRFFSRLE